MIIVPPPPTHPPPPNPPLPKVLHAGGKFGGDESGYKVSGGLHGVGVSVVNALSEWLEVTVTRNEQDHKLRFARGKPEGPMAVGPAEEAAAADAGRSSGTRVMFKPDAEIFRTTTEFEFEKLATRLDELAYLNPSLTLRLHDERKADPAEQRAETYAHRGGIAEYCDLLCRDNQLLHAEHSEWGSDAANEYKVWVG